MAKKSLFRALVGKSKKTKKLEKETARKKRYAQHFKKAGPKYAMTYTEWVKKGERSVYYKGGGAGGKQKTVKAGLREAGIDPKRFNKKK